MAAGGAKAVPEEGELSNRRSSVCDSEEWETSEDEGRTKSKNKLLPDGFLDPLPPQKLPRFSDSISLLRRAKKIIHRDNSSRGESSTSDTPSTPVHPYSTNDHDYSGTQQHPHQSSQESTKQAAHLDDGIRLTYKQGVPIRRRGRTTCADIKRMPPGTRVLIEINNNGVPCNIPESTLLGTYLGVVARDPMLTPLSIPNWRNKAMEPFKKKMLVEVESKFEFPGSIRHWILQSLGVKWRNYKTNLKAEHMDSRPIEEIMEAVPNGVDAAQWYQLVTQWSQPEDKERAARNVVNAKMQTCPHTMGRASSVRRQQETAIQDRLLLWKINRIRKDGSWSSEDARLRWEQACKILAEEELTPEDGNSEANERVFTTIMGHEHPGRVRTQGFGVTPTRYFPQSTSTTASTSSASGFARVGRLEEEVHSLRTEMRQFMQQFQMHFPTPGSSDMGGNAHSSRD